MSIHVPRLLGVLISTFITTGAAAQNQCVAPNVLDNTAYDVKPEDEKSSCLKIPVKATPDFHMLVFSWSPGFCQSAKGPSGTVPASLNFQCRDNKFGWVVHGLWAELKNPEICPGDPKTKEKPTELHPRYCRGNLPPLPESLVKETMCLMPGSRLIQGEWEKHGACTFDQPQAYFAKIRELRAQLVLPDTIMPQAQLFSWMREHNPILRGVDLDYDPKGNAMFVCYSTDWKPLSCPRKPKPAGMTNKLSMDQDTMARIADGSYAAR